MSIDASFRRDVLGEFVMLDGLDGLLTRTSGAPLGEVLPRLEGRQRRPLPTCWHLAAPVFAWFAPGPVPDLTRGPWLKSCDERWYPTGGRAHYVCTRIDDHTGRHAAGSKGRIFAVWGVKHVPATAEQGAADVVLEVTA